jgi:hypothetical protein
MGYSYFSFTIDNFFYIIYWFIFRKNADNEYEYEYLGTHRVWVWIQRLLPTWIRGYVCVFFFKPRGYERLLLYRMHCHPYSLFRISSVLFHLNIHPNYKWIWWLIQGWFILCLVNFKLTFHYHIILSSLASFDQNLFYVWPFFLFINALNSFHFFLLFSSLFQLWQLNS